VRLTLLDRPAMPARPARSGLGHALAAYVAWGVFPLYFKALRAVPPLEILAHRVVWSSVLLAGVVLVRRRWPEYRRAFSSRRSLLVYALSTTLVTVNWLLYIWGVTTGRVLEASLGYFVTPIVNVLLGVSFLGERLRRRQAIAVALAAGGVVVLVLRLGTIPWLALGLAFSFGGYGLVRKKAALDPLVGLLVETSLVAPLGAALILTRAAAGTGHLGGGPLVTALLLISGVVTALPLIWFAHGVRRLRLSTMGLIQYISPTLQFLCAVLLFHERFTAAHATAFAFIWAGLALYSWDALVRVGAEASLPRREHPSREGPGTLPGFPEESSNIDRR
jgi:chloramphenicol-sensitive protein RarD